MVPHSPSRPDGPASPSGAPTPPADSSAGGLGARAPHLEAPDADEALRGVQSVERGKRGEREAKTQGPGGVPPELVNSRAPGASNKEARRREAEEDRELIRQAQRGDQLAFRRLVERHQRRAFVLALGLVRDEHDARELVQEAFLRVYRGLATFEGSSSFFTWLYRIVTNLAIDLMRKPGRQNAELSEESGADDESGALPLVSRIDGADPLDVLRRREIATRIQAALDALPTYHRGVILMREVDGLSYDEMAQAMGVSKGTIMSRLFHARQKLQHALADCYLESRPPGAAPSAPADESGDTADDDHEPNEPNEPNEKESSP